MYREFDLIARITELFDQPEGVTFGIGDDCAVLDPGRFDLVTTDSLVEGVHFRRDWGSPADFGWRAIARCLSDIAAMGGGPGAFFMNLMLPPDEDQAFVDGLLQGMKEACEELVPDSFEVSVGGGDVTTLPQVAAVAVTMLGESSPAGPVMRSGAVPGDRIVLLGPVGLAAAALDLLQGCYPAIDHQDYPALLRAYHRPRPRVHEGALLGLYSVPSALIDISDGLGQDLGHIMSRSHVGATIETYNLPRHPEIVQLGERTGADVLEWMIGGGGDYELLICVPPARMPKLWELARRHDWEVYDIGEVRAAEEGLRLIGPDGLPVRYERLGYQHFCATS